MKTKQLNLDSVNLQEYNTALQVRHCDRCATTNDCPQKGSFHGNVMPLWNETKLGKFLKSIGLSAKIPFLTGFYANMLLSHNVITNVGHAGANGKMSAQGGYGTFTELAIGIGAGTASALDQALSYEITSSGGSRAAGTASQVTTTVANDTTQLVHTWNFSGSFAITEEGIFDATSTPVVTTLNGSINNAVTSLTATSGSGVTNNDYIQIDDEIMQVTAGGGTTSWTVSRAQKGTSAASHTSGVGIVDFTAGGGNMLAKQVFSAVNVNNGDSLQVTHKYQT